MALLEIKLSTSEGINLQIFTREGEAMPLILEAIAHARYTKKASLV
ncbi:hypothetical protein J31TS6_40930 [Brevibacillus reuszeri]|nr:hypothetical protein J31TS6_40930 [Brevibacillus reuszeri]